MNKCVKICALNSKFSHSNLAVHSLSHYFHCLCRKAEVISNNIKIEVHEYTVNDVYRNVLLSVLADNPMIVAFSVYIWNVDFVSKLCSDIKKISPEIKIILGGPEVSYGTSLNNKDYDYIIIGEGERSFFCLINELIGNDVSYYKKKFGYQADGKQIYSNEIEDLSEIPFVYSQTNIDLFSNRILYYESSRGCPFSCSYCLSAQEKRVRYLPLERVFSDIDFFIKNETIKQVKFVDRTFNSNGKRAYSIIEYIINNADKEINFHFEICADLLDNNMINLLSKAKNGLIQFEIGIQTTSETALALCKRKTDMKKCMDNITNLINNGNMNIHVDLIAGLPTDTVDSFKNSFNQVYNLGAHQFQLGFLKLLHGAPLNDQMEQYGYKFSVYSPYEILSNDNMTHEDLAMLNGIENLLEKLYNSRKFDNSLQYLIYCFDSPFDFFLQMSNYLANKDLLYKSISLENLYNVLFDFAYLIKELNIAYFKEIILLDYNMNNISDQPPKAVRDIWEPYKNYKEDSKLIISNANLTARKIGQKYYYFNYSQKNPVTSQYDLIDVTDITNFKT